MEAAREDAHVDESQCGVCLMSFSDFRNIMHAYETRTLSPRQHVLHKVSQSQESGENMVLHTYIHEKVIFQLDFSV
jgi:hypothetical protein